ncbi:MAG: penicillin-binding protein 2 [Candidatus Omnitrophica bacterium]|nr:penicillin-binding protein 2 [Candidatus Omnitrophota bacterium]MDD5488025.1 penicillin-binding protein 2 [Candidatus Omnitrophota bacterium]
MLKKRQFVVLLLLIMTYSALSLRLFQLQVVDTDKFSELADNQHNRIVKVEPRRGTIFDRHMDPLAINLDAPSIFCDPKFVKDPEHTARVLSEILGLDQGTILSRVTRSGRFSWLSRKVDRDVSENIKRAGLPGIHICIESKRNYPNDSMACHVLGFAGMDNAGLEGVERLFDADLRGEPGYSHMIKDARRNTVLLKEDESIPPKNGHNIILTIDAVIQYITEEELKSGVNRSKASSGTVIVMDPYSGRILALANYPGYDLNLSGQTPRDIMKNDAVSSVFEPGSVFKVVTASAVLNEGKISPDDMFDCENGEYAVGGRILHDYHAYGKLSFSDVIAKSSNIGTVKAAHELGKEKLYDYTRLFGFGENTGVDLPGEVAGINRAPATWSKSDITTIPIGQGIAVTPMQLACAISAIANGGKLMEPYIVDRVTTWEGGEVRKNVPRVKKRVLSEETSKEMKKILNRVVTDGTGKKAASKFFSSCGKTGTAQMVNPAGGYYDNKYNATFIGFAPMEDPVISIVVVVKDPQPVHFGGSVAGPVFKNISERTMQYIWSNKGPASRAGGQSGPVGK